MTCSRAHIRLPASSSLHVPQGEHSLFSISSTLQVERNQDHSIANAPPAANPPDTLELQSQKASGRSKTLRRQGKSERAEKIQAKAELQAGGPVNVSRADFQNPSQAVERLSMNKKRASKRR